jgi:CubicO group peptidase (beta-lactamase class C family)
MWALPRTAGPAGAICSTASEVVRFAQLHLAGGTLDGVEVLSEQSAKAMQQPQIEVPSGGVGTSAGHWGLGWELFEWDGKRVIGHDGGTIGQIAFLRAVPEAGVAIALLTNGGNPMALFRDVYAPLLAEHAGIELPAEVTPPVEPLAVDPAAYVGVYEREGASIRIEPRGVGIVGVMTVTGLGSEMTPEPFELPFDRVSADDDLFVTQHPAAPGMHLPVRFATVGDGSRVLHMGGRATPLTSRP